MKQLKIRKADLILLLVILLLGAVLGGFLLLTRKNGNMVNVRVDGEVVKTFPLNTDLTYEIEGYNGGKNLLIIKNGKARVSEASCPDGLCINMGEISQKGQSIVCLPNRVVVEVTNDSENDNNDENAVDVVVGGRT